jgi:hypothetical protein
MESNRARALVAIAAVVVVVVAFIVISGGSDSSTSGGTSDAGATQTITIKDGQPVGGVKELTYNKGDEMDIVVDSDTASEVHMHGYDVMQDVKAGGTTEFKVPADLEGEFEMELEETATQIAQITVNP